MFNKRIGLRSSQRMRRQTEPTAESANSAASPGEYIDIRIANHHNLIGP